MEAEWVRTPANQSGRIVGEGAAPEMLRKEELEFAIRLQQVNAQGAWLQQLQLQVHWTL
jgi:hypothetical protein